MSTGQRAVLAGDMLSREEIVSKLRQVPIFSDIGSEHLEEIAANMRVVTVRAGETVFSEGGPGDSMNIIIQGRVSIHKGSRVLKSLGPWEIFGEMALVDSSPRAAAASTVEDTTMLRLHKESFFSLLRERFALATGMLRALSQRIKETNIAIENLRDFLEKRLLPLGVALSSEKNFDRLLERILMEAKALCRADAGTIYILRDACLEFDLMSCDSPGIAIGETNGQKKAFPPLPLYDSAGLPNLSYVATRVAIEGRSVHVADVYRDAFERIFLAPGHLTR